MNPSDTIAADFRRALALHQQGNLEAAEPIYRAILAREADHFGALHLSGLILLQRGQLDEAVHRIDQAIAVNPAAPEAHSNRAHALQGLRRFEEALASCDRALALKPDHAEALNNRGNVLLDLGRPGEALVAYDRALAARPAFPQAHSNRGNALRALGRLPEALENYRRALQAWPDFPAALDNCGRVLRDLKRYDEAAPLFARLLAVAPNQPYAPGLLFDTRLNCCEWTGYEAVSAALAAAIERGERVDAPQSFVSHALQPTVQLKCAELYCAAEWPDVAPPPAVRTGGPRIHVAYLSSDLHEHATAHLMAGLFEAHDRTRFEVTAVSWGPDDGSPMRARLTRAFDRFLDVRDKSDREVALTLRELGVDIAVDLKGYTAANRAGILARRAAPLQVNYLGFPCSMGAPFIDYLIADRHIVPRGHEAAYAEKIVRLPESYQVNDDRRQIDDRMPPRAELGLPASGVVFCSFNNSFKIRPPIFDVWMRLLRDVDGSVLWLLDDNAAATASLRREAERRGVATGRLVFAPRAALSAHLARHAAADLFLDTFPYTAHTTASDALWAGLPLVTLQGETFASRVAASLLHAAGLPELVTDSLADYEALARKLATTPALLARLRGRLGRQNKALPLFDTDRFRRHLEQAYAAMHERAGRGEPPQTFEVQAVS